MYKGTRFKAVKEHHMDRCLVIQDFSTTHLQCGQELWIFALSPVYFCGWILRCWVRIDQFHILSIGLELILQLRLMDTVESLFKWSEGS